MTNAQYLVYSYFGTALLAAAVGTITYLLLRPSLTNITRALPGKWAGGFLKTIFPPGIILPALAGFVAVTFYSCNKKTYWSVVSDREYLKEKTRELIRNPLNYIVMALVIWGIIVAVALVAAKKQAKDGLEKDLPQD